MDYAEASIAAEDPTTPITGHKRSASGSNSTRVKRARRDDGDETDTTGQDEGARRVGTNTI